MAGLRLLADEHVPSVAVTALRSEGFSVTTAKERFGERTVDPDLLRSTGDLERTLLTNDRDFVRLHDEFDHAGMVMYTTQPSARSSSSEGPRELTRSCIPTTSTIVISGWSGGSAERVYEDSMRIEAGCS